MNIDRPLRILVGCYEIAGMIPVIADAFRANGHHVTSVIRRRNKWWPDKYDVDLSDVADGELAALEFGALVAQHDVIYFQWALHSFVDGLHDLPIYKRMGKKIIYAANGRDVRAGSAFRQLYESRGVSVSEGFDYMPLEPTMHAQRMIELCSDMILGQPNQNVLAIRPYFHGNVPVRLANYTPNIPGREVPLVVHAPSHRGRKGSDAILSALESLKQSGTRFDLRIVEDVPHTELINIFSDADIVIDQTNHALHGRTVVDAWASACAVASSDEPGIEPLPASRPLCRITPDQEYMRSQLKHLISNREYRVELANAGFEYAKRWHDHEKFGKQVLDQLSEGPNAGNHRPEFFSRSFVPEQGEVVPEHLKQATAMVYQQYGLPKDIDPRNLVARGLIMPKDVAAVAAAQRRITSWD